MHDDLDIELEPIVLTPQQCIEYKLPRSPIKRKEKRAAKFEQRFGKGATELDALEAIYPGELEGIVRENVERYVDPTLERRVQTTESEIERKLEAINKRVYAKHSEAISEVVDEYDDIRERITELEHECESLWDSIAEDLQAEAPAIDADEVPKPRNADPIPKPLYDSKRSYVDQLDHYHKWTNNIPR